LSRAGAAFEGPCFRHCSARYATVDEGTLDASARVGGRFNPPGEFGAVYVAVERRTALAELERRVAASGLPRKQFHPRVILQLRARLSRVLDLTDPTVRRDLDLREAEITGEDWARPQAVAREARGDGYAAIRFPSATGEGDNLAIFLDVLSSDDQLVVEDVEEVTLRP
jgi:RES domain-containing protein